MATWQLLLAAAAAWAVVLVAWKVRQAAQMMKFLTDATAELEGVLPQLQRDAAAFEVAWKEAWQQPQLDELIERFGGPPHPAITSLFSDPVRGDVSHVVLHGEGTPPEGYTLMNYFPAGLRWTTFADHLGPTEYAFAHDEEGDLYTTDWTSGEPVWRVSYLRCQADLRDQVAPSLAAFLAWRHEPGGV